MCGSAPKWSVSIELTMGVHYGNSIWELGTRPHMKLVRSAIWDSHTEIDFRFGCVGGCRFVLDLRV